MAEVKKKTGIDWKETMQSMQINGEVEASFNEKDFANRRANYLKSNGKGIWSVVAKRAENKIIVKRIS